MSRFNNDFLDQLDPLIRPAVEILNRHGFKTLESCQGGNGHAFPDPTVVFDGSEFDIIRAYELCLSYRLNVLEGRRIYRKSTDVLEDKDILGQIYEEPVNALVFIVHKKTKTIFFPH